MTFRESRTVKAIGQLKTKYPYAAALLSYVVIERVLKSHVLRSWESPALASARLPRTVKRHPGKRLSQLNGLSHQQRVRDVLCELTLGEVEHLLGLPATHTCSKARNDLVHSNLYLQTEHALSRSEQSARNRARFTAALGHLRRYLKDYEGLSIVEEARSLRLVHVARTVGAGRT